MTDSSNGVPFLTGGNLKDGRLDISGASYITKEKHEKLTSGHLIEDDIVIAVRGSLGALGYVNNCNSGWNINSQLAILRTEKNELLGKYLLQFLLSDFGQNELIKRQTGSALKQLPISAIKDINIPITSIEEQVRIGKMFYEIDNLITLHQRKYKANFYSWEQRKVTDIGNISIGLVTTMTKHYTDSGTLLIRNSDIKDNKFEFSESPIFLDKEFAEKNKSRQHRIGDVITVHTGDVGTSAVITENEANSIGFATIITRPNKNIITSNYLSTFLNTEKHKKWAVAISTGDGRTNYNLGDYYKLVLPVPNISEQEKISDFILKLDNLITLHQHYRIRRRKDKNEHLRW